MHPGALAAGTLLQYKICRRQLSNFGKDEGVPIHTMKACWRVEVQLHSFCISSLDVGECSHLSCILPEERVPSSHRQRVWVGPTASLDL